MTLLALTLDGAVAGIAFGLVAFGFTIIYRATRVINFAHGELLAVGSYLAFILYVQEHQPLALVIVSVVLAGAVLGMAIDRIVIGPLRQATLLVQVIALLGLARVLQGALREIFGAQSLNFPAYASRRPIQETLAVTPLDLSIVGTSLACLALLWLFLYRTSYGSAMRATAQNPTGARLMGINPSNIALMAWGMGGGLAALTGLLLAPNLPISPSMGLTVVLTAFAAVVVGGFGSLLGAVVGGVVIGVSNILVAQYLSAGYEPFVVLALLVLVLTIRPTGIFGEQGAA